MRYTERDGRLYDSRGRDVTDELRKLLNVQEGRRRGGLARSASKRQAARINGKKGGRPRKSK